MTDAESETVIEQLKQLAEVLEELEIPEDSGPVKTADGKHVGCPDCGYPLGSKGGKIMPCALCGWLDKPINPDEHSVNTDTGQEGSV